MCVSLSCHKDSLKKFPRNSQNRKYQKEVKHYFSSTLTVFFSWSAQFCWAKVVHVVRDNTGG